MHRPDTLPTPFGAALPGHNMERAFHRQRAHLFVPVVAPRGSLRLQHTGFDLGDHLPQFHFLPAS